MILSCDKIAGTLDKYFFSTIPITNLAYFPQLWVVEIGQ